MGKRIYHRPKERQEKQVDNPVNVIESTKQENNQEYQGDIRLEGYQNIIENTSDMDEEDIIQNRMLYLIENPEKADNYTEKDHFESSLKWFMRKRMIRTRQQQENMVSLHNEEIGDEENPIMVSVPKDYHLYRHILLSGNWTVRQMKVIAKRYLSGKTQAEIATEMKVDQATVSRLYRTIDSKILHLDIKENVSRFYDGTGVYSKADVWSIHYQDKPDTEYQQDTRPVATDKVKEGSIPPRASKATKDRQNVHARKNGGIRNEFIDGSKGIVPYTVNLYAWHDCNATSTRYPIRDI